MPTLAAITLHPTGGGVTVVADLLWRVLQSRGHARLVTMFSHENRPATLPEKVMFGLTMTASQVTGRTDWTLFSHLGLAQVQNALPAGVRRPYAVFLHGVEAWNALSATELRALTHADVRLSNSHYTAARVMAAHPGVGRVDACPLALPPERRTRSVTAADAWPGLGSRAVLVVGRMSSGERYKGHDQLIDVWPRVVASVPDAQLVIAGGGDDSGRLREKAAASSAAAQMVFTGYVTDAQLASLYRQAAVFALPSRGEGFGLVYLEAMAQGLPCIGSIHDAATDVIVDHVTGRLVDQDHGTALADATIALLGDADLRQRLGEAGRMRERDVFSFDRFAARVHELLAPLDAAATR